MSKDGRQTREHRQHKGALMSLVHLSSRRCRAATCGARAPASIMDVAGWPMRCTAGNSMVGCASSPEGGAPPSQTERPTMLSPASPEWSQIGPPAQAHSGPTAVRISSRTDPAAPTGRVGEDSNRLLLVRFQPTNDKGEANASPPSSPTGEGMEAPPTSELSPPDGSRSSAPSCAVQDDSDDPDPLLAGTP